jgi:N-methylhydantoinase B/oxoprolinase/acetone carboxylase alpha subunit
MCSRTDLSEFPTPQRRANLAKVAGEAGPARPMWTGMSRSCASSSFSQVVAIYSRVSTDHQTTENQSASCVRSPSAWSVHGGGPNKDGVEAITNASQNLSNTPVEVLEAQHPVRVEEYSLRPDSCGVGEWRGGVGVKRSYRVLATQALLQLRSDRAKFRPYGLNGGGDGQVTRNFLLRDGDAVALPSKTTMTLRHGDLLVHEQAGGGGFGDPRRRDPNRIRSDVWNEKISRDHARENYSLNVD